MKAVKFIVLIGLIVFLSAITFRMDFSQVQNGRWGTVLLLVLALNFVKEVKKKWKGEESAWDFLTLGDKLIFVVGTIVLLVFCLYPIMEEMHLGIFILMAFVGISLVAVIANKFGSEALKEFLWWS
ncbi:MAG: hypothetical protein HY867_10400 [Chloroflexi bacterium]|nr:hypothetical protein [Chloroflexota bacterium]